MALSKGVRSFAMNALRRASYKWPGRFNTLKKAHIGRNQYLCAGCGGVFKKKEINLDHVEPVMPIEGTEDFNVLIERLFVPESGWQVLCKDRCHAAKTEKENEQRRLIKSETKPKKKSRKK